MQLETSVSTVSAYASAAKEQGLTIVLNAAPSQSLPDKLLAAVDILVVNEGELATAANCNDNIASCVRRIDVPCVVVTLGRRGCCATSGDTVLVQSGFSVKAVDTTAAGDTFCGVLVAGLSQGQALQNALQRANAAGALACIKRGAQTSIPDCVDIELFLQNNASPTIAETEALRKYCGFIH